MSTWESGVGHDVATPDRDSDDVEVVRSEDQLHIGTEVRVTGRAVLRKYIVTETVTQTFEVRHEEVRLEELPGGDDQGFAADRRAFDDDDDGGVVVAEMVLHREVPVVQMKVEAVERVRLHVDTVVDQVTVSEDLRSERIDLDSSGGNDAGR